MVNIGLLVKLIEITSILNQTRITTGPLHTTLTQQLDAQNFEVEIITNSAPVLCEGESITLSASINNPTMTYSWSNGMTGPSIEV